MSDTMHGAAVEAHEAGYVVTECRTCEGFEWWPRAEYLGEKRHVCGRCSVAEARKASDAFWAEHGVKHA